MNLDLNARTISNYTCNEYPMKKKLTLVIDDEVIERAKRHARTQNTSVSEMVENYLTEQTRDEGWSPPTGSVLTRLTGAVTPDSTKTSDEERLE